MTHPLSSASSASGDNSTPVRQLDQPLGLTVHSIPLQGSADAAKTASGRWKMLAVLLVCAAPVIASYVTYYVIRPEARRNFGELIDPQRPMPSMATQTVDGKSGTLADLKGQWLLVTVGGGACDADCEKNLYFQRQLRESLGKEMGRLDRVWLINDAAPVPSALGPALAGASVVRVKPEALTRWLEAAPGQPLSKHLYVVDPLGNWMLRFPPAMDRPAAAKAKRDLDRLLRASTGWDREGRGPAASLQTPTPVSGR